MSYLDAPVRFDPTGGNSKEHAAPEAAKRLALICFWSCLLLLLLGGVVHRNTTETLGMTVHAAAFAMSCVGTFVRSARISVDDAGVLWRVSGVRFRLKLSRIKEVHAFDDSVGLVPKRGSNWYLSAGDWENFEELKKQLLKLPVSSDTYDRNAPLLAKLQAYGRMLNIGLVMSVSVSLLALFVLRS